MPHHATRLEVDREAAVADGSRGRAIVVRDRRRQHGAPRDRYGVDAATRRLDDHVGRVLGALDRLQLRERATNVVQGDVGVRRELVRLLELMEGAHRLRDRRGELDESLAHWQTLLAGLRR